ncbi:type VI secretion system lipoprotein TssJ [Pseudomonas sp. NPDC090202]|uniref:type VI secretion system lipoprotein TssJ n=1 Tax=unclassified Pseudomonas TaxID=196821 RepID=UPI0038277CE2
MPNTVSNALITVAMAAALTGCGLFQSVADSTSSTTRAIFYKQVKDLRLDFSGRAALNTDAMYMSALSVPTLLRIYQTTDNRSIQLGNYDRLLDDDEDLLGAELLDKQAVLIKPGEGAQLNVPLNPETKFITVVALLRTPDLQRNSWRLTLKRDDLDPDQARIIELGDDRLVLRPLAKE